MELVNTTPLAARIDIGAELPSGNRRGLVVAKATYRVAADGRVILDSDDPFPIFMKDELTAVGLLPRDDIPRLDDAFELMLLGRAHAPRGRPAPHVRVTMALGDVRRAIDVFGDRRFVGRGPAARISEPEPFSTMPLTWSRTFGGTEDVEIDDGTFVPVMHPENPLGKGFDVEAAAKPHCDEMGCPPGYPRFDTQRVLPNLENPAAPIRSWHDQPRPWTFAPMPMEIGAHARRAIDNYDGAESAKRVFTERLWHRAHPEWVFGSPPGPGTPIVLEGATPEGEWRFRVPDLGVSLDYVLGRRAGVRPLALHAIVLLPEERRFYAVYRAAFQIETPDGTERAARLRIESLPGEAS